MQNSSNFGLSHFYKLQKLIGLNEDVYKYLHNTCNESIAQTIVVEGFDFESHIDQTADLIAGADLIELKYFMIKRSRYGHCTVVIEIAKDLVDHYSKRLLNTNFHFSEVMSCRLPYIGDNDEPIYRLPSQFIKGFFNHHTHQEYTNTNFNPYYHPACFYKNLKYMLHT